MASTSTDLSPPLQIYTVESEPVSEPEPIIATSSPVPDFNNNNNNDKTEPNEKEKELVEIKAKWPGWPGYSVFRLVIPVLKVGSIIGRKGELIKNLVQLTRANVRVLDGPISSPDRIVLISGKEEPEAALSPAMDATIRVFKSVNGLPKDIGDGTTVGTVGMALCSVRMLVPSSQAISLIGKQGCVIKSIQENTGASIRVLTHDELPLFATSEERIVEIQGEALKVLKGLEAVVGHLRKFLVDRVVLPLFEKSYNTPAPQERQVDAWSDKTSLHSTPQTSILTDYHIQVKRDPLLLDRGSQIESNIPSSRLSLYGPERGLRNALTVERSGGPFVTQVAHTMQIPLAYAEDIIGVQGANIDFIRRSSRAILTVQESMGLRDEIIVEIKGTFSQVQKAEQLIEYVTSGFREELYGSCSKLESRLRQGNNSYSSSSPYPGQLYSPI